MPFEPVALNLPNYPFKISQRDSLIYIFDEIRKKHLVLTPEEWVRQHFIQFLVKERDFPTALLQIEGGLKLNQTQKRNDILVFNRNGQKLMVIECKAPKVKITQAVFDQAARYNSVHKTPWIAVTNGLQHYYAKIDHQNQSFAFIEDCPFYSNL